MISPCWMKSFSRESLGRSGIGRYMSKNMIEKNLGEKLSVRLLENSAESRLTLDRATGFVHAEHPVRG